MTDAATSATETPIELQKRLRWQCRRGMLEMDFLLRRYLDSVFLTTSSDAKSEFEALLKLEDDLLWDYLLGTKLPANPSTRALIDAIRTGFAA